MTGEDEVSDRVFVCGGVFIPEVFAPVDLGRTGISFKGTVCVCVCVCVCVSFCSLKGFSVMTLGTAFRLFVSPSLSVHAGIYFSFESQKVTLFTVFKSSGRRKEIRYTQEGVY